jgi:ribosomal protein L11 methyltransferase
LRQLVLAGLDPHPGTATLVHIRPQNWAESWKRHFKPLEIHSRLLIRPSWSKRKPKRGQAVVVLEPGLSFGTGNHPTTAYCLEELVAHRTEATAQGMLDLGTGSGILAIAAARLGYAPIEALDVDPDAIRIARENARTNHAAGQIHFSCSRVEKLSENPRRKFPVVCANLISNLLIQERKRILSKVQDKGILVLAGILKVEFEAVAKAFQSAGMRLLRSQSRGEWRSGTWAKRF